MGGNYSSMPTFNGVLTHWGRVTHICVSELPNIGSDNSLSPGRRQPIIWTNAGILLIRTLGINFSENLREIHIFSLKKMYFKMSSGKRWPFCLGLNVSTKPHLKLENGCVITSRDIHGCSCLSIPNALIVWLIFVSNGDSGSIHVKCWHIRYRWLLHNTRMEQLYLEILHFVYSDHVITYILQRFSVRTLTLITGWQCYPHHILRKSIRSFL